MIRLRALEREDLRQLRDWRNDPEIFARVREYRFLNMENQEAWFNSLRDDRKTIMFGVETELSVDKDLWKLIGVCGLTNIDWVGRKAEVSIYIGQRGYRGKGIGTKILNSLVRYAFEECNLKRLWAEVFAVNIAGAKLFLKAGYKLEGRLRCHSFKGGMYNHSYIYGLLSDEWREEGPCATS